MIHVPTAEERQGEKFLAPILSYIKSKKESRKPLPDNEFYASELASKCERQMYLERKEGKDFNSDNGILRMYLGQIIHEGLQKAFKKKEIEVGGVYEEQGIRIRCRVDVIQDSDVIEIKSVGVILEKPKFGAAVQAEIYSRVHNKQTVGVAYFNLTGNPFQFFTHTRSDGLLNWVMRKAVATKKYLEANELPPQCKMNWCKACYDSKD